MQFLSIASRRALTHDVERLVDSVSGPLVMHTHFTRFDVPVARVARSRNEAAVVWHLETALNPGAFAFARNALKYALLGRAVDAIFCTGPDMERQLVRRGAPQDRVRFLANPIDVDQFPPLTPQERMEARRRFDLPDNAIVLAHFGWWWHVKGGDFFVPAVSELRRRGHDVVGVTVGAGDDAVRLRSELRLGADTLRIIPFQDRSRDAFAAADVFVSCSRREGWPFSVSEAFCVGLPVVATDIPGHAIQAPGTGARRLVGFDSLEIADAVESLLARTPEQAQADEHEARAWFRQHQDVGPWSEKLLDFDERLLS